MTTLRVIKTDPPTMPPGPFGQGTQVGDVVYVAGQVAYDHDAGGPISSNLTEQVHQVVVNLKKVLGEAGARLTDIVKLTCILPNLPNDYQEFNAAFAEAFEGVYPPRTTIQAGLLGGYKIEIEAIAHIQRDA